MPSVTDVTRVQFSEEDDSTGCAEGLVQWLRRSEVDEDTVHTTVVGYAIIVTCGCVIGGILETMVKNICPP